MKAKKAKERYEIRAQNLGGPKVYNFHGKIDGALLSRADRIDVRPRKERGLVNRRMVYHRYLDPVIIWLRREARKARARWDRERVNALILSDPFIDAVEELPADLPRYSEIGLLQLATAKLMGWDLGDLVHDTVKTMGAWDEDELEAEVREVLAALLGKYDRGGDRVEVELKALTNHMNSDRKTRGERRVYKNKLAATLRDMGFRDGETKVKDPRTRRIVLILTDPVLRDLRDLRQSGEAHEAPEARSTHGDVDRRTFRRLPPEEIRASRCTKCGSLKDLTREDPNRKLFCESCFEAMTGGGR